MEEPAGILGGVGSVGVGGRTGEGHTAVGGGVFVFQDAVKLPDEVGEVLCLSGGNSHHRVAAGADHVVKLTALEVGNPQRTQPLHGAVQHTADEVIAAAAALVDLRAGVTALQTADGHGEAHLIGQRLLHGGYEAVGPQTAGAGDSEHTLLLGVQIQQAAALQVGAVQRHGAVHARLLVHGDDHLQRGVGQGVVRQNGEGGGNGDAVIAAQRGLFRPDIPAVGGQIQTLPGHVLGAVLRLGADHVHVALQNNGGGIFIAGGGVLPDNDIVAVLLPVPQAKLLGHGHAQVTDDLGVAAAVRHGAQPFKIVENRLRLQMRENSHVSKLLSEIAAVSGTAARWPAPATPAPPHPAGGRWYRTPACGSR